MRDTPTEILIVEDNPDHAQLAKGYLESQNGVVSIASSHEQCRALLRKRSFDIILLDYDLPDEDGLAILRSLNEEALTQAPIVLVTGHGHEQIAVEAMKAGAFDYVVKSGDFPQILSDVIIRVIEKFRVAEEKRRFEEEIVTRNKELQVLNAVSVELNDSLVLCEILNRAVTGLVQHLSLDAAAIWLRNETGDFELVSGQGTLSERDGRGNPAYNPTLLMPNGSSNQPMLIDDVAAQPLGVAEQLLCGSLVVLPMLRNGQTQGYCLATSAQPSYFTERRMNLLGSVASQISAAVENARLYAQTETLKTNLEKVLNSSLDMIITLDENGLIQFYNERFKLFSGNNGAAVGRQFTQYISEQYRDTVAEQLRGLQEGVASAYEAEILNPAGEVSQCLISQSEIKDDNAILLVIKDTSDIVKLQNELAQAEKLSALGHMIAGAAHELNNPLAGIMGYAQLLQEEELPSNVRKDISVIQKEANRCQGIVQKLLAFARRQASEQELVSVNLLVETVLELHAHRFGGRGVDVALDLDSSHPFVLGDYGQLQQVIVQLLGNAHDAVRVEQGQLFRSVRVRTRLDSGSVRLEVCDNGPGIPKAVLQKVLDPFFTTKEVGQGMGLGLSMCFGIIESHRGRLTVNSEQGKGTTVVVELPVAESEPAQVDVASVADPH